MPPRKARKAGIVDEVVRPEALQHAAASGWWRRVPGAAGRARCSGRRRRCRSAGTGFSRSPPSRRCEQSRGHYPAPLKVIDVVQRRLRARGGRRAGGGAQGASRSDGHRRLPEPDAAVLPAAGRQEVGRVEGHRQAARGEVRGRRRRRDDGRGDRPRDGQGGHPGPADRGRRQGGRGRAGAGAEDAGRRRRRRADDRTGRPPRPQPRRADDRLDRAWGWRISLSRRSSKRWTPSARSSRNSTGSPGPRRCWRPTPVPFR